MDTNLITGLYEYCGTDAYNREFHERLQVYYQEPQNDQRVSELMENTTRLIEASEQRRKSPRTNADTHTFADTSSWTSRIRQDILL